MKEEKKEKCGWCGKKAILAGGYYCQKCMSEKEIKEKIGAKELKQRIKK